MNNNIKEKINQIIGMKCNKATVILIKSLHLAFGKKKKSEKENLSEDLVIYNYEYLISIYRSSWRIMEGEKLLIGIRTIKNNNEINNKLKRIKFGKLLSIEKISDFDVRIEFDNNIRIECFKTFSDDDEIISIETPDNMIVELDSNGKWFLRKSDRDY